MPAHNCDIWDTVDFGRGPVEVRCTKTGEHDNHKCEVYLNISEATVITPIEHQNIFEKKEETFKSYIDPREAHRI